MTALLLDTSAWIEYLRDTGSSACEHVGRLLTASPLTVVSTPPVVMELLAGATSEPATRVLDSLTTGLTTLELEPAVDFHAAATAYRASRRQGVTVRGLLDCLIAVVALRHGATLVHRDADLARLVSVLPGLASHDLR